MCTINCYARPPSDLVDPASPEKQCPVDPGAVAKQGDTAYAARVSLLHLYRTPGLSDARRDALLAWARESVSAGIRQIETEHCFNVDASVELAPVTNSRFVRASVAMVRSVELDVGAPGTISLADGDDKAGGKQMISECSVEIEGQERPACVAETITVLYG